MKELGRRLKKARLESGVTQLELSQMVGLSLKEVQKIEWGKANPTLRILTKLARKLSGLQFKVGKNTGVKISITNGKLPLKDEWMGDRCAGAVADKVGLCPSNVYKLCGHGRSNPTAKTLEKLGIGLGISFIIS